MTAAERKRRQRARPPEITELRNELRNLAASLGDGIDALKKRLAETEQKLAESERKRAELERKRQAKEE
jgi:hypothetical protein